MHTLRGMPKRLPCIPEGGWPRLWMGVSGPIGAVISPVLTESKSDMDLPFASSLCGACREACPVKITCPGCCCTYGQGVHAGSSAPRIPVGTSHSQRVHTNHEAPATVFIGGASHAAGPVSFSRGGRIRSIPVPPLSKWTKSRDLPAFKPKSFRDIWKQSLSMPEAPDDPTGGPPG